MNVHGCAWPPHKPCMLPTQILVQVEVDYQGGGTYKRKYRVREVIAKGPMDLFFTNTQVCNNTHNQNITDWDAPHDAKVLSCL